MLVIKDGEKYFFNHIVHKYKYTHAGKSWVGVKLMLRPSLSSSHDPLESKTECTCKYMKWRIYTCTCENECFEFSNKAHFRVFHFTKIFSSRYSRKFNPKKNYYLVKNFYSKLFPTDSLTVITRELFLPCTEIKFFTIFS